MKLCDKNCNECPIILHPNSRMISKILNRLYDIYGNGVYSVVQDLCPNLTVCYDCGIDDFCHFEDCKIVDDEKKILKIKISLKLNEIEKHE